MNLKTKEIINLTVQTKSGQNIGRIVDFDIDPDSQKIATYYVKSGNVIEGLFKNELIINQSQVISLDKKKMVVDDNTITEQEGAKIKLTPEQAV